MSGSRLVVGSGRSAAVSGLWPPTWRWGLQGSDTAWAIAFAVPYLAIVVAFVIYPIAYGLWMGRDPALYGLLFSDPLYLTTAINTLLFVAIGVNVQMFLAFLLSGFIFDIRSMPPLVQVVTYIVPARYFVEVLKTLFLAGTIWPVILPNLSALAAMAAILLTVTAIKTKRSLE